MRNADWKKRDALQTAWIAAFAAAACAVACVQTNVTRAPRDEAGAAETPRERAAAAAEHSPSPTAAVETLAASVPTPEASSRAPDPTPGPDPVRVGTAVAGEPVRLHAAPCLAQGQRVRRVIDRPESLDLSYRGAVNGVEVRQTMISGSAGFRHAKLSGGFFEADYWVRGAGISVGALGSESCRGGEPGEATFEVIAHYR
ncbi:MAG: hypothetical protein ABI592_00815 [Acidobacteriota bacterium]